MIKHSSRIYCCHSSSFLTRDDLFITSFKDDYLNFQADDSISKLLFTDDELATAMKCIVEKNRVNCKFSKWNYVSEKYYKAIEIYIDLTIPVLANKSVISVISKSADLQISPH